jgi:tRNA threonylcarbamoyl adenosine modification protein (Sua5/YciO/YrdC/YwlC family)
MDLGDRGDTIAVRVPDHDFTRRLLAATGPLAVSSANVSGEPAATTVESAQAQLGDSVAVYVDAGPATGGVPSTIVDLSGDVPAILREGAITRAQLAAVVPALAGV